MSEWNLLRGERIQPSLKGGDPMHAIFKMTHNSTVTPLRTVRTKWIPNIRLHFMQFFVLWMTSKCFAWVDITGTVFEDNNAGVLAAFGDFNSDKLTDVFRIVNNRTVDVLIAYPEKPLLRLALSCSVGEREIISAVMPGDFNGDSMMDVLITVQIPTSPVTSEVRVLWGSITNINCSMSMRIKVKTQPLLLDYNGDMVPDLFAEDENGTRAFWVAQKKGGFIKIEAPCANPKQQLRTPHSCSFTDLNLDGVADLFVTGTEKMEYWYHVNGHMGFPANETFDYPGNKTTVLGQSTFVDLDTDGTLEHILPLCHDPKCASCSVVARSLNDSDWHVLIENFVYKNSSWCFRLDGQPEMSLSLRSSDFNVNGYPDFVVVLRNGTESQSGVVLLRNVACSDCTLGRKLEPVWDLVEYDNLRSVQVAAFYDIYEDGILDLLVSNKEGAKEPKTYAIQNIYNNDAYFIKVIVIGGLCQNCPGGHAAYGTNQPGPYIKYTTTKADSHYQIGCASQMYQSAHFALQLPYVVFGLGQIPNFVDSLEVTIPGSNQTSDRKKVWTQLIPNSQMVVIPYPTDKPSQWVNKLFVTPSRLVLMTFAALVGTCLFIGLIIGGLYWKERREDRREKLLEAHKFHFDAM